jgi:hypothetical protein
MNAPGILQIVPRERREASASRTTRGRKNVLILALDAVTPADIDTANADVLVVAPALNSWLRRWLSDEDAARRRAADRLRTCLDQLQRRGVRAEGQVGDADPLLAIADALRTFPADEIVIAGSPEHTTRLTDDLAARARRYLGPPVLGAGEPLRSAA